MNGTVTLNKHAADLRPRLDARPGRRHDSYILGNSCNMLKASTNPVVDATFDCSAIIF